MSKFTPLRHQESCLKGWQRRFSHQSLRIPSPMNAMAMNIFRGGVKRDRKLDVHGKKPQPPHSRRKGSTSTVAPIMTKARP